MSTNPGDQRVTTTYWPEYIASNMLVSVVSLVLDAVTNSMSLLITRHRFM
jgi:hypothetical protein